jgi:CubicO group peptidase (beta-lactamase class C family)
VKKSGIMTRLRVQEKQAQVACSVLFHSVVVPVCVLLVASSCYIHAAPASTEFSAVDPAKAGWNTAALDDLVAYVQSQKTTGFLILQNRKVIYEHNWPLPSTSKAFSENFTHGTDSHGALQEDVASAQKSFVAILAGIAIDKGLIDITKTVSAYIGPGWSKAAPDQEEAITVRNLMEMSSGLSERLMFEAPAGAKFFYNTTAYAIMKPVLEKASGLKLDDLTRQWLTEPAEMNDTLWRQRPEIFKAVGNATGLYTTPRDMAKLGQLVLDKGRAVNGKRVISTAQLDALFERSATNPAYGRWWWLNGSDYSLRPAGLRTETELIPAAPAELVAALGAQDRKIYIVRSRKLVVVRTGHAAPDRTFDQQVWLRMTQAMPKN